MSGVGTAIAIGTIGAAGIGAATSLIGSSEQAGAAKSAADLQYQEQQDALNFQEKEFATNQANQAPFLKAGTGAINSLAALTSTPGEGLLTPYGKTFTPPSMSDVASEPGFQFTEQQGQEAIDQQAAATGNVFSGNTLRAASNFNTGLADTYYNDAYNRALQTYGTNYNVWAQNQANQFNRLSSMAGEGQVSANQLGVTGQAASSNVGGLDIATGANIASEMNNAAAAEASGYVGAGNAVGGGINSLSQYAMLSNLLNNNSNTNTFSNMQLPDIGQTPINPAAFGITDPSQINAFSGAYGA